MCGEASFKLGQVGVTLVGQVVACGMLHSVEIVQDNSAKGTPHGYLVTLSST